MSSRSTVYTHHKRQGLSVQVRSVRPLNTLIPPLLFRGFSESSSLKNIGLIICIVQFFLILVSFIWSNKK
jgi:hypothetical protein